MTTKRRPSSCYRAEGGAGFFVKNDTVLKSARFSAHPRSCTI